MNPEMKDGFLYEVAQAQMARDIFPNAPLKYMPPTKYMTGDIFRGYLLNGMFNLAGVMTGQSIQLLGMLTEAIHTPHVHDRYLAIKNAKYVFGSARHLGEDVVFRPDGIIQRRAAQVLDDTTRTLEYVRDRGLMDAMGEGIFAGIARAAEGGRGLDGVVARSGNYWNPFEEAMSEQLGLPASDNPSRRRAPCHK
jgi:beta-lysine 5,6-aminomutase alpha subunit